ncbi:hypothetical protein QYE76_045935 [Lolium multiflorum]|uniref:RRM domain-containing protein n=1 Tax=Lolium multiflorum TaxID=4521 RepID=A0AAD8TNZ2_LOLMU|nr:hypothetical protein QYE76_045935 [Lolium multiflorum]
MPMPPPQNVAISQQFGIPMPAAAATASVDGPPSRAVVLSLLPPHTPEAEVARAMAPFGDVRAVDSLALPSEGVATVHFFDLRAAERAVSAVREQHMAATVGMGASITPAAAWHGKQPRRRQEGGGGRRGSRRGGRHFVERLARVREGAPAAPCRGRRAGSSGEHAAGGERGEAARRRRAHLGLAPARGTCRRRRGRGVVARGAGGRRGEGAAGDDGVVQRRRGEWSRRRRA